MRMRIVKLAALVVAISALWGCNSKSGPAPEKMKLTAYINVSSGCQAPTVELIQHLVEEASELVSLELVDFGSPSGYDQWRGAGLECMTLVFEKAGKKGSALRFPDKDGNAKVVAFVMPAGFSWTHEDLSSAFEALRDEKLEILTQEETQGELSPRTVELETSVRDAGGGGQVLVGGNPVFTVKAKVGDKSALSRAKDAQEALARWLSGPVQPSDLQIEAQGEEVVLWARDIAIIRVVQADAQAEQQVDPSELATSWLQAVKAEVVEGFQNSEAAGADTSE